MNDLIFIIQIIVIVLFLIGVFIYFLSLKNSLKYKVPQVSTFSSDFVVLEKYLWKYDLKWKKIVDLWCGIWKVVRFFEKKYKMKAFWYEIDSWNVLIARIINKIFSSKVKVSRWDYFNVNLNKYDFIYIYLYPQLMDKVEKKIWKDAAKWTIIFVNAFKLNKHKPIDIFLKNGKEKIFVYKI